MLAELLQEAAGVSPLDAVLHKIQHMRLSRARKELKYHGYTLYTNTDPDIRAYDLANCVFEDGVITIDVGPDVSGNTKISSLPNFVATVKHACRLATKTIDDDDVIDYLHKTQTAITLCAVMDDLSITYHQLTRMIDKGQDLLAASSSNTPSPITTRPAVTKVIGSSATHDHIDNHRTDALHVLADYVYVLATIQHCDNVTLHGAGVHLLQNINQKSKSTKKHINKHGTSRITNFTTSKNRQQQLTQIVDRIHEVC